MYVGRSSARMVPPRRGAIVQPQIAIVSSPPVPVRVQHVASSANPAGVGITGKTFQIPWPNPVLSGNCLVLRCTYPHGSPPTTISDTVNGAWSLTPAASVDAGVGGYVAAFFLFPNTAAGQPTLTVAFASAIIPFEYTISEYSNIALTSPANGSVGAANVSAPNLACGSFTPGNNNANGGNLILAYFPISGGASGNPTLFTAGSGFTLDSADIAWNTGQGFPHASEHQLQTTAAAVNPGLTATGDTSSYNCLALALKVASAGTPIPAGIHINSLHHFTSNLPPNNSTWKFQVPFTGNLRVLFLNNPNSITISGVVDSEGNVWTKFAPLTDAQQCWRAENTSPNANATVTLTISGTTPTASVRVFDIQGAAVSPLGATAAIASHDVSNVTTITNQPSITPQAVGSLIIAGGDIGQGPGLAVTSPAGAIWDLCIYPPEETDLDLMENADLQAHILTTSLAALNWNWNITSNPNNSSSAIAVEFKAA